MASAPPDPSQEKKVEDATRKEALPKPDEKLSQPNLDKDAPKEVQAPQENKEVPQALVEKTATGILVWIRLSILFIFSFLYSPYISTKSVSCLEWGCWGITLDALRKKREEIEQRLQKLQLCFGRHFFIQSKNMFALSSLSLLNSVMQMISSKPLRYQNYWGSVHLQAFPAKGPKASQALQQQQAGQER